MSKPVGSLGRTMEIKALPWNRLTKIEKDYYKIILNVKSSAEYRRYTGKFGVKVGK